MAGGGVGRGLHHRRGRDLDDGSVHPPRRNPDLRGTARGGRGLLPVRNHGGHSPFQPSPGRDAHAVARRDRQSAVRRPGRRPRRQDFVRERAVWRARRWPQRRHSGGRAAALCGPSRSERSHSIVYRAPRATAARRARTSGWPERWEAPRTSPRGTGSQCGCCRRWTASRGRWCCGRSKTSRATASGRTTPISSCSGRSTISTTRQLDFSRPIRGGACSISIRLSPIGSATTWRSSRRAPSALGDIVRGDGASLLMRGRADGEIGTEIIDIDLVKGNGTSIPVRLLHRAARLADGELGRDAHSGPRPSQGRRAGRSPSRIRSAVRPLLQRHALRHCDA